MAWSTLKKPTGILLTIGGGGAWGGDWVSECVSFVLLSFAFCKTIFLTFSKKHTIQKPIYHMCMHVGIYTHHIRRTRTRNNKNKSGRRTASNHTIGLITETCQSSSSSFSYSCFVFVVEDPHNNNGARAVFFSPIAHVLGAPFSLYPQGDLAFFFWVCRDCGFLDYTMDV